MVAQPVFYHNHPHFEICFCVSGHSRILVEGPDLKPRRGDVLIDPPGIPRTDPRITWNAYR